MNCTNHPETSESLRYCSRCGRAFCPDCLIELQGMSLCAACKNEQMLDLRSGTTGPLSFDLASVGRRWAALIVDRLLFVLTAGAFFAASFLFTKKDDDIAFGFLGAAALAYFAYVTYDALMVRRTGQTLGKRLLKIRVVRADGQPVRTGQAWGRALTRAVAVHVLTFVNYLPALFTQERTCVHDLLAGTRVVNAE